MDIWWSRVGTHYTPQSLRTCTSPYRALEVVVPSAHEYNLWHVRRNTCSLLVNVSTQAADGARIVILDSVWATMSPITTSTNLAMNVWQLVRQNNCQISH
jgi:hypothetical protein